VGVASWWSEDGTGWMYVDGLNNEINNGMNEMNDELVDDWLLTGND